MLKMVSLPNQRHRKLFPLGGGGATINVIVPNYYKRGVHHIHPLAPTGILSMQLLTMYPLGTPSFNVDVHVSASFENFEPHTKSVGR